MIGRLITVLITFAWQSLIINSTRLRLISQQGRSYEVQPKDILEVPMQRRARMSEQHPRMEVMMGAEYSGKSRIILKEGEFCDSEERT
jgi:hypothetical protein